MKDGRTHLAHKAEHAVDVSTGALIAVTLHPADAGDTTTGLQPLAAAQAATRAVALRPIQDAVLDKGYHSDAVMVALQQQRIRSYVIRRLPTLLRALQGSVGALLAMILRIGISPPPAPHEPTVA